MKYIEPCLFTILIALSGTTKPSLIVNVSSIAGKEGNPSAMPYSAAKAGVIALTQSLGKELADKNIAVNCVTPAAAKTRIFDQISEEHIN